MANAACTSLPCVSPGVDVQGSVSSTSTLPYLSADSLFSGSSDLKYSVEINQISSPPESITTIPILVNFVGETQGIGSTLTGYILDGSGGQKNLPLNAPWVGYATVGTGYTVVEEVSCSAGNTGVFSSECQAQGDPTFQFDQAAFDAEMGANTFSLAEYYSFEYSPNLTAPTATPEPSSLSLVLGGLFVIGIMALRGRFS